MNNSEKVYAGIFGGVVADALGVPYEFSYHEKMIQNPATTMTGFGTYNQPVGTWSDDSSMTLACLDSLSNGVNYEDMITKFCEWINDEKYTPHGDVFDYGDTTYKALMRYPRYDALECGLTGERDNGNGSLMRIMPAILYANAKGYSTQEQMELIDNTSALTHAHPISKASCNIYNFIAQEILENPEEDFKTLITKGIDKSREYYENDEYECFDKIYNNLFSLAEADIFSKGYVVDSLEVALYFCYHTTSYKDAVLKAVNTGGDTDTNALITGGLAALYYGYDKIPGEWLEKLVKFDYIKELCDNFVESL